MKVVFLIEQSIDLTILIKFKFFHATFRTNSSDLFMPCGRDFVKHMSFIPAITQYNGVNQQCQNPLPCLDVDSKTDSNHDTALTLACAGGHDDLVELLINRGADIEHRDKKGFTPLILAATAGHEKVVEVLLNHNADIEAQSERTKDTPLSLACSGGRYEVLF
jgi:ankyrin repeat protein